MISIDSYDIHLDEPPSSGHNTRIEKQSRNELANKLK